MAITRTDRNQRWANGALVSEDVVEVDVTDEAVRVDIHTKARAALGANATYLALASPSNAQNLAQIRLLTRECSGVIRLLLALDGARDLLVENTDT